MFLSIVWEWRRRNKWSTTKWTAFPVHCWPEICRLHHSTRQWLRWKRRTGSRSVVKVTYATEFPVTAENCHYPRALPISYTRTKLDHQSSVWRSCGIEVGHFFGHTVVHSSAVSRCFFLRKHAQGSPLTASCSQCLWELAVLTQYARSRWIYRLSMYVICTREFRLRTE